MNSTIRNLLILTLLFVLNGSGASEVELPELGDSSSSSLTPARAEQIGSEMVRRMRQAGVIIDDPLIDGYIQQLGHKLASHTQQGRTFTFFVVDAPSINAFALPGGYIGVHSGLILASRNESEVAGVVAHEIAHVTQHHIARGVEEANRTQLPLSIAVIAAILLSSEDVNAANATLAAGLGGSEQMKLNFTRSNEQEADRVGMQLLASTEYDPQGMANFFNRLQAKNRYYGDGAPEFLRTHPVTTARLAEAKSAASRYPQKMHLDSSLYQVTKARLRLHHSDNPTALMKQIVHEERMGTPNDEITLYLKALTAAKLQQDELATELLSELVHAAPNSIAYRYSLGQLQDRRGDFKAAIANYREGLRLYPHNELLSLSLTHSLIEAREYDQARAQLQEILRRYPGTSRAYQMLAQLEARAGNKAASILAQAEHYRLEGELHSALEQLRQAKQISNLDFYHASRIEAMSNEIKESLQQQAATQE